MKTIQVLGPGCAKCRQLAENAERAARTLGIEFELQKVTDLVQIADMGVMMTPAMTFRIWSLR